MSMICKCDKCGKILGERGFGAASSFRMEWHETYRGKDLWTSVAMDLCDECADELKPSIDAFLGPEAVEKRWRGLAEDAIHMDAYSGCTPAPLCDRDPGIPEAGTPEYDEYIEAVLKEMRGEDGDEGDDVHMV